MDNEGSLGQLRVRLMDLVTLCSDYCFVCQNAPEIDKAELTDRFLNILPRLYWEFLDLSADFMDYDESNYFSSYVDEDYYESIRRNLESVFAEDDVFLETFEEDMKYSESPIAASISESLADIFQPLFNFISIVKDTEGESIIEAYINCKEEFESYWSQTLCNVLRALNHLKFNRDSDLY